jgi:hypothetical protein
MLEDGINAPETTSGKNCGSWVLAWALGQKIDWPGSE